MSTRNCIFPWHWAVVTNDGDVLPCSHGSASVGNLKDGTLEQIWNGPMMQEVRGAILEGRVHPVCACAECPFQREQPAFPVRQEPIQADEDLFREFDEAWYLETHAVVRQAVQARVFVSGLEHFIRHGRRDGAAYRLRGAPDMESSVPNAILALIEYARGATVVRNAPVDLIVVVTTLCNLRCVMCPQGMRLVENPHFLPAAFVAAVLEPLRRASRVIMSGVGEPTLAPPFWEIVRQLPPRDDLFLRVHSNGHFMTDEHAEMLLDSGMCEINFSVDAATDDVYAFIRGGDFGRVQRTIDILVAAKRRRGDTRLKVMMSFILMGANLDDAPKFVELGKRLGVDAVVFSQLFTFGDRPDWRVERQAGTFIYSEQMPSRHLPGMRKAVREIQAAAERTGTAVQLRDNVAAYCEASP